MRKNWLEVLVLGIFSTGAIVSGAGIVLLEFRSQPSLTQLTQSLGSVFPNGGDVRRRSTADVAWVAVNNEAQVFGDDHIFTGKNSSARVILHSKQKLSVTPNSLVIIRDQQKTLTVNVSKGGFFGVLKKGLKLVIEKDNSRTELVVQREGTSINLEDDGSQSVKLVVLKGEMSLSEGPDEEAIIIKENSEATLTMSAADSNGESKTTIGQVKKFSVKTLSPSAADIIWSSTKKVKFLWENLENQQESEKVVVEVGSDSEMSKVLKSVVTESSQAEIELGGEGTFYWRVRRVEDVDQSSPISSFTLASPLPPVIKDAPTVVQYTSSSQREPILIEWSDPNFSNDFEFLLAQEKDFQSISTQVRTQKMQVRLNEIAPGSYFFKVISHQTGRGSLESQVYQIEIIAAPESIVPQLAEVFLDQPVEPVSAPVVEVVQMEKPEESLIDSLLTSSLPEAEILPEPPPEPIPEVIEKQVEIEEPIPLKVEPEPEPAPEPEPQPIVQEEVKKIEENREPTHEGPVVEAPIVEALKPPTIYRSWIEFGLGASFLLLEENLSSYSAGTVSDFKAPQLSFHTGSYLNETHGFEFGFKQIPGTIVNSSSGQNVKESFAWKILSLEYLKRRQEPVEVFGYPMNISWQFGLQSHSYPTILPVATNSSLLTVVITNITLASLGTLVTLPTDATSKIEIYLNYQHPFAAGTNKLNETYTVTPRLSFDGSIGYVRKIGDGSMYYGTYWFGQWQNFRFKNKTSSGTYLGTQTLFNSTVDIRLGYEF